MVAVSLKKKKHPTPPPPPPTHLLLLFSFFFFQAEDGIRDSSTSRGLGDVYKRQQRLAAALRLFGKFGFDEGVAGHITVRDPIDTETFWVNPMGRSFKLVRVSDLIRVSHDGDVVDGEGLLNGAAFTIHSQIHRARPEVTAAAHAHSVYGKTWSSLGLSLIHI